MKYIKRCFVVFNITIVMTSLMLGSQRPGSFTAAAAPQTSPTTLSFQFVMNMIAADGEEYEQFGNSHAADGDTLAIGAPYDHLGNNGGQGSVYIFQRNQDGADAWGLVKKITASDGEAYDYFGYSVALQGDILAVGAYGDDPGDNYKYGVVYLFYRNQGGLNQWGQAAKITPTDPFWGHAFGASISLSGDTLVIGAWGDASGSAAYQGAAYIFQRNQGGADQWGQVDKLTAADGSEMDFFGERVFIKGDWVVVGVPSADVDGKANQGSAYLFYRNQGGADQWGQFARLSTLDGAAGDRFGAGISLSDDTLAIGAPNAEIGSNTNQGAVYLFYRNQGGTDQWGQAVKLTAPDGKSKDYFGAGVSINGYTLAVQASYANIQDQLDQGAAYIFERNLEGEDTWAMFKKLLAPNGAAEDYFGNVTLHGNLLVIGAAGVNISDNIDQGSAYLYTRQSNRWALQAQPTASAPATGDQFGYAVAVSGNQMVVGAPYADPGGSVDQGAAFIYTRNQGDGPDGWGLVGQLVALDGAAGDQFGRSVAIYEDTIVVGAPLDTLNEQIGQGSAYVFRRNQGGAPDQWGQVAQLSASDGAAGDAFGTSVAIDGEIIAVGSEYAEVEGRVDQGAVYLFYRNQNGADQWGQVTKLVSSDGAANDHFGSALDLRGGLLAVGAPGDDISSAVDTGSAYVFYRNQSGADLWGQIKELSAPGGAAYDYFGGALALHQDMLVIGAYGDDATVGSEDHLDQGTAYVFQRDQGGLNAWGLLKHLLAPDGAVGDCFGRSAAAAGDIILVGAPCATSGQGAAYLFARNRSGINAWGQSEKLATSSLEPGGFGNATALDITLADGNIAVVGASLDNTSILTDTGSTYVFYPWQEWEMYLPLLKAP